VPRRVREWRATIRASACEAANFGDNQAMETLQAILTRKVTRKYSRRAVALDQLQKLVEAGRHAMSARNRQPWNFIVVRDAATLAEIGRVTPNGPFIAEAPAAIVVLQAKEGRFDAEDCAQAVQNIANAAWDMGLGTCRPGIANPGRIKELLGIPEQWEVYTVMPIGYPDEHEPPQKRPLKKHRETTHYERFGRDRP